ncbi:hypothetical protein HWD94_04080 [Pseudarthrobacter equi]|uniref:hypothetical protein n=1 Tax=Pseudarthrobacter equi TaxID=728066 RepID=UPI0021C00F2D|nr:hypothetical protein [Pseudarthrobacter equi]MCT9624302.1 hypothetical protein [Pseudarthrobacter equi]
MAWGRTGDTAANHPAALAVLEHDAVDERLLNEVYGFIHRCSSQSAAHLTDYIVNRGTVIQMAGMSRAKELIEVAIFAGLLTEVEVEVNGQPRKAYKIIDDPEFIHLRTREEIEFERQRKTDNANPALIVPVRMRDGDACRYCGLVVSFAPGVRKGRLAGTYDHRNPGKAATVETYVVACGACNSARSDHPNADQTIPLLPVPIKPYYSKHTIAWIETNDWAQRNGIKAPQAPAQQLKPGTPTGNGTTRPAAIEPQTSASPAATETPSADNPQIPADSAEGQCASSGFTGTGRDGSGREGQEREEAPDPARNKRRRRRPRNRGRN